MYNSRYPTICINSSCHIVAFMEMHHPSCALAYNVCVLWKGHGNIFSCCQNDNLRGLPVSFFMIHILGGLVLFMTDGIVVSSRRDSCFNSAEAAQLCVCRWDVYNTTFSFSAPSDCSATDRSCRRQNDTFSTGSGLRLIEWIHVMADREGGRESLKTVDHEGVFCISAASSCSGINHNTCSSHSRPPHVELNTFTVSYV